MLVLSSPGFWPRRSKVSRTPGQKVRQCADPSKWNLPSWSPGQSMMRAACQRTAVRVAKLQRHSGEATEDDPVMVTGT